MYLKKDGKATERRGAGCGRQMWLAIQLFCRTHSVLMCSATSFPCIGGKGPHHVSTEPPREAPGT